MISSFLFLIQLFILSVNQNTLLFKSFMHILQKEIVFLLKLDEFYFLLMFTKNALTGKIHQ